MHVEAAPFVDLFEAWDGTPDPESALGPLHSRLAVR
jgi:hypothetical protein